METNKPLARSGYLLGAILVILPVFDLMTQVLPLRPGDEKWRFGVVGQLSSVMLVPLLGLLLIITIATVADSRRIKRIVGSICGIIGLFLAIITIGFILDYFQVRTLVNPKAQHVVGVATATATAKNVLSVIVLALLSRAGFAGPRALVVKRVPPPVAGSPTPLIPLSGAARAE